MAIESPRRLFKTAKIEEMAEQARISPKVGAKPYEERSIDITRKGRTEKVNFSTITIYPHDIPFGTARWQRFRGFAKKLYSEQNLKDNQKYIEGLKTDINAETKKNNLQRANWLRGELESSFAYREKIKAGLKWQGDNPEKAAELRGLAARRQEEKRLLKENLPNDVRMQRALLARVYNKWRKTFRGNIEDSSARISSFEGNTAGWKGAPSFSIEVAWTGAKKNPQIIGHSFTQTKKGAGTLIEYFAVNRAWQRSGVAGVMMNRIERRTGEHGERHLFWEYEPEEGVGILNAIGRHFRTTVQNYRDLSTENEEGVKGAQFRGEGKGRLADPVRAGIPMLLAIRDIKNIRRVMTEREANDARYKMILHLQDIHGADVRRHLKAIGTSKAIDSLEMLQRMKKPA
ncbi:MAG: hypothetical protein V1835_06510 [Candidatus Micrarchaeota archaeon]